MLIIEIYRALSKIFEGRTYRLLTLISLLSLIIVFDFIGIGVIIPIASSLLGIDQNPKGFMLFFQDLGLINLAIIFVSVFLLKAIFQIFLIYKTQTILFNHYVSFSKEIFANALTSKVVWGFNISTKLARDTTSELEELIKTVYLPSIFLISELIVAFFISILLIWINFQLVLIVMAVFLSVGVFYWLYVSPHLTDFGKRERDTRRHLMETAITISDLGQEFKSAKSENFLKNRAVFFAKKYSDAAKKYQVLMAVPRQIIDVIAIFIIGLIFFFAELIDGANMAVAAAFGVALIRILPGMQRIVVYLSQIKFGWRAKSMEIEVLENQLRSNSSWMDFIASNLEILKSSGTVEISGEIPRGYNINDTYSLNQKIFKNGVNILRADSGFGKTSLLNCIAYKLHSDSQPYYFMTQNSRIFESTLMDNITLGRDFDENEVNKCLEIVELKERLKERFGNNYLFETINSKNDLSGGQEQRICLARALISRAPIILLDEPFSNIDNVTLSKIYPKLIRFANDNNIIMLVVSHGDFVDINIKTVDL